LLYRLLFRIERVTFEQLATRDEPVCHRVAFAFVKVVAGGGFEVGAEGSDTVWVRYGVLIRSVREGRV
jgi:hypothetical protein